MISTPTLHPFLSHFPTALFVAGCVLLYLGRKRNQKLMVSAASLNFSMGLLASILAALSGMFATDLDFRSTAEIQGHQGYAFAQIVLYGICTTYSYTQAFSSSALWFYGITLMAVGATAFSGYLLVFHSTG